MKRIFWIGVGVGLAVYVARRWRTLQDQSPAVRAAVSAGQSAAEAAALSRGFIADFKAGMAARERELRASLLAE